MADVWSKSLEGAVPQRAASREKALPGRVCEVILFGSRARGDARPGSDYDIAVFVSDLADGRRVNHALADTAHRHVLAGFHIRPFAVPSDFLDSKDTRSLAREIARDGVPIR